MASKIDVRAIITDHVSTLKKHGSSHIYTMDIFWFLVLPALLGYGSYFFCITIKESLASILATAFSIFAALLFNLLLLVYDLLKKEEVEQASPRQKIRREVLDEIAKNVSFNILVALIVLVLLVICSLSLHSRLFMEGLSSLTFFLVAIFLLTLLMILKRIHNVLVTTFT